MYKWKNPIVLNAISIKNSKNPKISYIINETLVLPFICDKCGRRIYWGIIFFTLINNINE